jgi:hypothetical protein
MGRLLSSFFGAAAYLAKEDEYAVSYLLLLLLLRLLTASLQAGYPAALTMLCCFAAGRQLQLPTNTCAVLPAMAVVGWR